MEPDVGASGSVISCTKVAVRFEGLIANRTARGLLTCVRLSKTVIVPSGRTRASCWSPKVGLRGSPTTLRLWGVCVPPNFHFTFPLRRSMS